jgi:hypothetical protein
VKYNILFNLVRQVDYKVKNVCEPLREKVTPIKYAHRWADVTDAASYPFREVVWTYKDGATALWLP